MSNAGFRTFPLRDDSTGIDFPVYVTYPSDAPEKPAILGSYRHEFALNGAIAGGLYRFVVLSHGSGGTPFVHRGTAAELARNGFIVAMPEHPGNNNRDNALAGTVANLENRPRHLRAVIDWAFSTSPFAGYLIPDKVAAIGHSIGGYTALAVAGGAAVAVAPDAPQATRRLDVRRDERVAALVLLAPATSWFAQAGALEAVRVPILMLTGEKDTYVPEWFAQIVERGVPDADLLEHRTIANAGHFSFQSPFPEKMADPAFAPSQDPEGFDRARFNEEMNAELVAFLNRVM